MAERKMVRLDDLSPEVREQVEAEVLRRVEEDRLRRLFLGNNRLIAAICAVNDQGGDPSEVLDDCMAEVQDSGKPQALEQ